MIIESVEYEHDIGAKVIVEGYNDYELCFSIYDIIDVKDFRDKIKSKIAEIDAIIKPFPQIIPEKFFELKAIEGSDLVKDG